MKLIPYGEIYAVAWFLAVFIVLMGSVIIWAGPKVALTRYGTWVYRVVGVAIVLVGIYMAYGIIVGDVVPRSAIGTLYSP